MQIRHRMLLVGLLCIVGSGCVGEKVASVKEDPIRDNREAQYDKWVGKTKSDRIRAIGMPSQCLPLKNGGEACEWRSVQPGVIFTYNHYGVASCWSDSVSLEQSVKDGCDKGIGSSSSVTYTTPH